jgi:hypothetical protein
VRSLSAAGSLLTVGSAAAGLAFLDLRRPAYLALPGRPAAAFWATGPGWVVRGVGGRSAG